MHCKIATPDSDAGPRWLESFFSICLLVEYAERLFFIDVRGAHTEKENSVGISVYLRSNPTPTSWRQDLFTVIYAINRMWRIPRQKFPTHRRWCTSSPRTTPAQQVRERPMRRSRIRPLWPRYSAKGHPQSACQPEVTQLQGCQYPGSGSKPSRYICDKIKN